jgi:hypothetical protein
MIDTIKHYCFGCFVGSVLAVIIFYFLGWDNTQVFLNGVLFLVVVGAIQSYQELTKK